MPQIFSQKMHFSYAQPKKSYGSRCNNNIMGKCSIDVKNKNTLLKYSTCLLYPPLLTLLINEFHILLTIDE